MNSFTRILDASHHVKGISSIEESTDGIEKLPVHLPAEEGLTQVEASDIPNPIHSGDLRKDLF